MPSARLTRSGKHTPKCRRPPHNCRSAEDHEIKAPPFSLRDVWFETKMCSCWQILHINPGAKAAEFPLSSRVQVCAPGNKILIFAGTSFRFSYLRRYKFTASRPRSPPLLLIDSAAHQGCGIFRNQNSWNLCPPDLRSSPNILHPNTFDTNMYYPNTLLHQHILPQHIPPQHILPQHISTPTHPTPTHPTPTHSTPTHPTQHILPQHISYSNTFYPNTS